MEYYIILMYPMTCEWYYQLNAPYKTLERKHV